MKKHFILTLGAILALVSCEKEQDVVDKAPEVPETNLVPLSFTAGAETKTSLDEDRYIIWSKDTDHINVFSGDPIEYNTQFTVTNVEDNGKTAVFSGLGAVSPEYYALFPYDENAGIDEGVITATLPNEQVAVEGSFGPTANLAVARFRGSEYLQFKNVGALVGITVSVDDVDCIKLEALGVDDQLTGTVHVTLKEDGTIDEINKASGIEVGYRYATLSGSFENGKTYYFVVLPGTYSSGFQVKFYKGSQYVSFSKTSSVTLARNGIKVFNGTPGSTWKSDFTRGEKLYIRNSKEAGQECVYITPSTPGPYYWNTEVNSDLANYDWEYEIFTQLTGGNTFHFQAEGGERFTITSDGTSIIPIPNSNKEQYSAPVANDNLYRIRLNITSRTAEVRQITSVYLYQHGRTPESTSLTYWRKGDWFVNNFCTGKGSDPDSDDRYKFRMELKVPRSEDPAVTEEYGRWKAETGNPTSYPDSFNKQDYFYVQPTKKVDGNWDAWDPGFKYAKTASNDYEVNNRYYVRVGLCMNNRLGQYTHTITDILDIQNPGSTKITIQGTGALEAGQELAFVGRSGYWDTTTSETSVTADYPYNYEIFTELGANPTIYFKSAHNVLFGLYDDNGVIKVKHILSTSETGSLTQTAGIYRIRMDLTTNGGAVDIKQITAVKFKQHGVAYGAGEIPLDQYLGNGTWKGLSIPMRRDEWSWNNRYKFHFYYADSTNEYYGRSISSYSTPDYSTASPNSNYFWVQPASDDSWEPCFQFPSKYQINEDRYYGDITLSMNNGGNNVNGHYTHSVSGIVDNKDLKDLTDGEDVYIDGNGAAEKGQKLTYVTTKGTDLDDLKDPTDFNYEIFTKLNASENFFFRNADGTKKFAINTDGDAVEKIAKVSDIGYEGVDESDKVYRIRLNFSTGSVSIKKVTAAYYSQPTRHTSGVYNEEMTYVGHGCWQLDNYAIDWAIKPSWGTDTQYKYYFKIQYDGVATWQNFLKASGKSDYDTKPGTDWSWSNGTLFYASEDLRNASTATITLKLNAENSNYTHTVTDIN